MKRGAGMTGNMLGKKVPMLSQSSAEKVYTARSPPEMYYICAVFPAKGN